MKTIKEIYAEINAMSKYEYFDITYKANSDFEVIKDTIKLIEITENGLKVGAVGFVYTIPLEKIVFISEPNEVVLRYRLKSEYLGMKNTDNRSLFLFNAITHLFNGNKEKAVSFIGAQESN